MPLFLDDRQRLSDFSEGVCGAQQLFALVSRADDGAQPRLVLGNDRITYGRCENAGLKKPFRKFNRFRGIANVDRNDRRLAAFELEPALLQFALEELGVGPELFQELFAFRRREQGKRRLAFANRGRWVRSREEKRPRAQIEKINEVARPFLYSTSHPPATVGACQAAFTLLS